MEKKWNAFIVEDEPNSRETLKTLITRYCPELNICGEAGSVSEAVKNIPFAKPNLVFLDISLPDGFGFDILDQLESQSFGIIFTTAYEEYALRAFRVAAIDYLLKPITYPDLQKAMIRFRERHSELDVAVSVDILRQAFRNNLNRIALPTQEGFELIDIDKIIRCEADSNYTRLFIEDRKPILVSRSLSYYESQLTDFGFVRTHHKHLVNMRHVRKYHRGRGGFVEFADGTQVEVAARKKDDFFNRMVDFAHGI